MIGNRNARSKTQSIFGTNALALGMSQNRALRPLAATNLGTNSWRLSRKLVVSGTVPSEERLPGKRIS
jgi:hypothetical protein